jgi:hypothetical protein
MHCQDLTPTMETKHVSSDKKDLQSSKPSHSAVQSFISSLLSDPSGSVNIVVDNARSSYVHRQKMVFGRSQSLPAGTCRWNNSSSSQHSSSSSSSNSSSGDRENSDQEWPAPPVPRRHSVTVHDRPDTAPSPPQERPFNSQSHTKGRTRLDKADKRLDGYNHINSSDSKMNRRSPPQREAPPPTSEEESDMEDTDISFSDSDSRYSSRANTNTNTSTRRRCPFLDSTAKSEQESLSMALINTIERLSVRAALTLSRPHLSASSRVETMEAIDEAMDLCSRRGSVTDVTTRRSYAGGDSDFDGSERSTPEEAMADQTQRAELNNAMIHAVDRLAVKAALTLTDQHHDAD